MNLRIPESRLASRRTALEFDFVVLGTYVFIREALQLVSQYIRSTLGRFQAFFDLLHFSQTCKKQLVAFFNGTDLQN